MTKTSTWIGKAAVLSVCLALVAALVLAATNGPAEAQKKKAQDPQQSGGLQSIQQTGQRFGLPLFPISVTNADKLDGKDSTEFLAANGKAADSDKIDGKDSTELVGQQGPKGDPGPQGPEGPQGPPGSGLSPDQIYQVTAEEEGPGGEELQNVRVNCDDGDKVLGGGGDPFDPEEDELRISSVRDQGWNVTMKDNGDADVVQADAICADFPPLRKQ